MGGTRHDLVAGTAFLRRLVPRSLRRAPWAAEWGRVVTAHVASAEGVPEDVGGGVVVETGVSGDAGDDGVGSSDAETPTSLVEEQCGAVGGAGPVGVLVEPAGEGGAQVRVGGHFSDPFALAVDPKNALAGGEVDVVDVERDDLDDAGAGVEREERDGLVAGDGQAWMLAGIGLGPPHRRAPVDVTPTRDLVHESPAPFNQAPSRLAQPSAAARFRPILAVPLDEPGRPGGKRGHP